MIVSRPALAHVSYAAGCALAAAIAVEGFHDLALTSRNPVGPALLYTLAAIAAWLIGRAMRLALLPPARQPDRSSL